MPDTKSKSDLIYWTANTIVNILIVGSIWIDSKILKIFVTSLMIPIIISGLLLMQSTIVTLNESADIQDK